MPTNRDRYVTVCQQLLVTAAVLTVGVSSAGVMTLQIVAPEHEAARRTPAAVHQGVPGADLVPSVRAGVSAGVSAGGGVGQGLVQPLR
jgi:hypothetical protein